MSQVLTPPAAPVTPANPQAPAPTPSLLESLYDVSDDAHVITLPEPAPKPAAAPPTGVTPAPVPAAQAVPPPPPSSAAAPKTPAPGAVPEWLKKKADEFGIPASIVSRATAVELDEMVMGLMKSRMESTYEALRNPAPPVAAAAAVQPPPPAEPEFDWGEIEEVDANGRALKRKVVEKDEIFEPVAHVIKRQDKRIAELEAFIKTMTQQVQVNQERTVEQQFDAAFSKHAKVFGSGAGAELKGTPEFDRRVAVFNAVKMIPPEVRKTITVEQAVERVSAALFGAVAAAATEPPAAESVIDRWNAGSVQKPTQRQGRDTPHGEKRARESVTAWAREQADAGASLGGDTSIDEFLS